MSSNSLKSVYLGGGTPSILPNALLARVFKTLHAHFDLSSVLEITLEANPDDITLSKLQFYKELGINRMSLGVQSFFDSHLQLMNRAHKTEDAEKALKLIAENFENYTIDLIYGIPQMTAKQWESNVEVLNKYKVPHFSAYALTIEENTLLHQQIKKKVIKPVDDEVITAQYQYLVKRSLDLGYEAYEISNFSKPNKRAQHNSKYWRQEPYLGVGPSAHSFNGLSRRWNVSNNHKYISLITKGDLHFEEEQLNETQLKNEYILTRIRTIEGIEANDFIGRFGSLAWSELSTSCEKLKQKHPSFLKTTDTCMQLSFEGKMMSDFVTRELMFE